MYFMYSVHIESIPYARTVAYTRCSRVFLQEMQLMRPVPQLPERGDAFAKYKRAHLARFALYRYKQEQERGVVIHALYVLPIRRMLCCLGIVWFLCGLCCLLFFVVGSVQIFFAGNVADFFVIQLVQ